jgi:hypothetical protein
MDRRLQEIERELDSPGRSREPVEPPEPAPDDQPTAEIHALPVPHSGSVSWPLGANGAPADDDVSGEHDGPAVDQRSHRSPGDPHERAAKIIASAHAEAARIVGDAAARVAAMTREIEELRVLREELREVLSEDAVAVVPSNTLFEGEMALGAGPFTDISTLSEFERALAGLDSVTDARVRGFEGDHAVLEITLARPVRLLDEMERALPWDFMVERTDGNTVSIRLLAG